MKYVCVSFLPNNDLVVFTRHEYVFSKKILDMIPPFYIEKYVLLVLVSRPSVLPDWLHKHAPYAWATGEELVDDEVYAAEIRWLESCTRMLETGESTQELRSWCKPPTTYR